LNFIYGSEAHHFEGRHNWFDIGLTYYLEDIVLMGADSSPYVEIYPMLLALGQGYGSVNIKPVHLQVERIKIYPHLVHALKSTSAKHLAHLPTTTRGWHTTFEAMKKKIESLKDPSVVKGDFGGFQIKLSIKTVSVLRALDIAESSDFMFVQTYLQRNSRLNPAPRMFFKPITLKDYFINFEKFSEKCNQLLVRKRHDLLQNLTSIEKRAIIDLSNVLGWNPGGWHGTNWNDNNAWWLHLGEFMVLVFFLNIKTNLMFTSFLFINRIQ